MPLGVFGADTVSYIKFLTSDPIRDIPRTFHGVCDKVYTWIIADEKRKKAIVPIGFWRGGFGGARKKAA
jgi:hypothetical protein